MPGKKTDSSSSAQPETTGGAKSRPLVTVSGEYGARAHEVGAALAEKLGVGLFDYRTLDHIVAKAHADRQIRGGLDTESFAFESKWIRKLIKKDAPDMSSFLPYLVKTIMAIIPQGGVIIGHGAHLILVNSEVLRLKVEAGPEVCIQRISEDKGVTIKAATKMAQKVNKERIKLVKSIYDRFPTDSTYYDLVLSSEILNTDQIVKITLAAMKEAKLPLK